MKKKLSKIIIIFLLLVFYFYVGCVLIKAHNRSLENRMENSIKSEEVDLSTLFNDAVDYDNLFQIKCDGDNLLSGSEVICKVSFNSEIESFEAMDDVLKYVSFEYELGNFLSLENISLKSRYDGKPYEDFELDTSKKNTVILKNNHVEVEDNCNFSKDKNCTIHGRVYSKLANEKMGIYDDSILNVVFQFKLKISEKASYADILNFRINNLNCYLDKYDKKDDTKSVYKMNNLNYQFLINKLESDEFFKIFTDNLYKVRTKENSTFVYVDSSLKNIGGKIEKDRVFDVYKDWANYLRNKDINNFNFNDYKSNYGFLVKFDGKAGYVKYSDVEIISDSINYKKNEKSNRYYVYDDEYLYNGPGISFQDNKVKIPKGTILTTDVYINSGSATWIYVDYQGNKGWLLVTRHNPVNYPYNNVVYGKANEITEKSGTLNIGNNIISLYRYPFSKEKIMDIPKNTSINYDYITSEIQHSYYHVSYNGVDGFISVWEWCLDDRNVGDLYMDYTDGKEVVCE